MSFRFVALFAATVTVLLCSAFPAVAGELRQSDRALLAGLKEDALWAGPASRLAADRAAAKRVQDVAGEIADDLSRLDVSLRALADRLAVGLPDTPTADEQSWADEIAAAAGGDLDRVYVNRMRAAYGSLFGLASEVRAGTRDDNVRSFAQTVVDTTLRHMTLLESTGLAETTSLLVSARTDNTIDGGAVALGAVLVAIATAATFGLVRLLGSPGKN